MKKFFGVVLMFLAVCELIGIVQMKTGSTTFICFTIAFFLFGLYLYLTGKRQDGSSKEKHSVSNPAGFTPTKIIDKYLEIDEVNKKWVTVSYVLGKRLNSTIYDFSDIIQFELLEDGNTVTQGGLGRALVGGAMFGGVGAIVGGITGMY